MVKRFINLFKHTKYAVFGAVLLLSVATAGVVELVQPNVPQTAAASCDKVNIIYCGLKGGSSLPGNIGSLRDYYNSGSDGRYNDLQAVYQWAGATDSSIAGMNVHNTQFGTMYRNGDVKVNGKVVGTDAWISARFGAGQHGFVRVPNTENVWARKTTTSMAEATAPVLVHFDQNGQADFAVMINCGNAVRITPIPVKPPKADLVCNELTASQVADTRTFNFTASATPQNTTITKYVFEFSKGSQSVGSRTVNTSAHSAKTSFDFSEYDTKYSAMVTVYSKDFPKGVTSAKCHTSVTTPKQPVKPALACVSLSFTTVSGQANTYMFTAKADASHTTITKYVFNFGDNSSKTVNTGAMTASAQHTYATNTTEFTATVTVYSKDFPKGVTAPTCQVTIPKVGECKPGVPEGSPQCTECKPGVPEGSPECTPSTTPPSLPNTGAGNVIGLFGATTAAGALLHRLILRRKMV